jgi:hypothetical protein
MLHYEIWSQLNDSLGQSEGRLLSQLASGTIQLSSSVSTAIAVPTMIDPHEGYSVIGIFKVLQSSPLGLDRAYVEILNSGTSNMNAAHLMSDVNPRMLIGSEDGAVLVPVPKIGSFTAILAASIT